MSRLVAHSPGKEFSNADATRPARSHLTTTPAALWRVLHNTVELDRAGLCWDADLVRVGDAWQARSFRGSAWTLARTAEARSNRINAYRVLLTRARHGTVIWVPRGDAHDPTRTPALYDGVAEYLRHCGALALDEAAPPDDTAACLQPELL